MKLESDLSEKLMIASDLRKYRKLTGALKSELAAEETILGKINDIKTFHQLLADLASGEHIIRKLDSREKRIIRSMEQGASMGGITDKLIAAVFDAIEDKVHEAVADRTLEYHPNVDLEFVNRPEFIELVINIIQEVRGRMLTQRTIMAFVSLFREKYNHERD